MTTHQRARILADLVGALYGLSEASLRQARRSAARCPTRAIRCYGAILRSLGLKAANKPNQAP